MRDVGRSRARRAMSHPRLSADRGRRWRLGGLRRRGDAGAGGYPVTLFEQGKHPRRPRAPRRASTASTLDNGQHLLIGAYRQTLDLIATVHGADRVARAVSPAAAHARTVRRARARRRRAAARGACRRRCTSRAGILAARGLSWRERLALVRGFRAVARAGFRCPAAQTVAECFAATPRHALDEVWSPLCIAALNTPPARASAQVFATVLREAFGARAGDSDFLVPALRPVGAVSGRRGALRRGARRRGRAAAWPCAASMARRGASRRAHRRRRGALRRGDRRRRSASARRHGRTTRDERTTPVVRGTTRWRRSRRSPTNRSPPRISPTRRRSRCRRRSRGSTTRPVSGCSIAATRLAGRRVGRGAHAARRGDQRERSARRAGPRDRSPRGSTRSCAACAPALPPPLWSRVIAERRATYACTPALARPAAGRIAPGLYLAGRLHRCGYCRPRSKPRPAAA